jgi:hypothetical protein
VVKHTLRISLGLLLGALVAPVHAQAPANSVPVKTYTGYYNDTAVFFAAFETNDAAFSAVNGIVYAPKLGQVNSGNLPQMIFFMNSGGRQTVVLQTQPGQPDYNPLWRVVSAFWNSSDAMPLITSFAAANQLNQQGKLVMQDTGIVFNGPVFMVNRPLDLSSNGTLAPTISPNDFLGINPAIRTAYFKGMQGYYGGQLVTFLGLEHAPGEIEDAPGAIPVPTISLNNLGANGVANFYEIDNQPPVIDSVPIRQVPVAPGTTPPATTYGATGAGQSTGIPQPQGTGQSGQQPGVGAAAQPTTASALYSPIWHVSHVAFRSGVTPQLLRSVEEIQQAAALGMVDITPGGADDTFNCPVPYFYQAGTTTPGNPVYTPPTTTNPTTPGSPGYVPPTTTPPTGTTPGGGTPPY